LAIGCQVWAWAGPGDTTDSDRVAAKRQAMDLQDPNEDGVDGGSADGSGSSGRAAMDADRGGGCSSNGISAGSFHSVKSEEK